MHGSVLATESDDAPLLEQNAVEVSAVFKGYQSGRKSLPVLKNLNMTVPRGTIYGLLGPSGCGKTTLLRCILGSLKLDSGSVTALGARPGSPGHQIPGRMVGYMPQELALYTKFSIGETLSFFGRLHKMDSRRIAERTQFLISFLGLPEKGRLIDQLSGGQQRRTSFAIALLQEPKLLVLDEPTVGVDPLLRQRIWEHMLSLAHQGNISIIITTHYVEEARQAHMVGLMRDGKLLAESAPNDLMESYHLATLEEVFLKLCIEDEDAENPAELVVQRMTSRDQADDELLDGGNSDYKDQDKTATRCRRCCQWLPSANNILALIIKNLLILKRNIGFQLFQFLLPAIQICLFCLCIGREPFNLTMNIVNNETCSSGIFCASRQFLDHLDNRTFHLVNSSDLFNEAIADVKDGNSWGVINIGENFTVDLMKRFAGREKPDNQTLEGSTVHLHLDMTNQMIAYTMQNKILEGFQTFARDMLETLGMNPAIAELPVSVEQPVYGTLKPSFTNFMAPGVILSITYFMATGLTALSFVLERKQGLMDRSYVAGVNNLEIMVGHICTQFLVMLVQVMLLLVFALAVFNVRCEGSLVLCVILCLLQGLVGMSLGLLVSTACEEETSAIQAALGTVYPNLLLSGIIWPLESMPTWLLYISYALPMTFASQAMRGILARGWGLEYMQVWRGFVMSIGWGWLLLFISALILSLRKT